MVKAALFICAGILLHRFQSVDEFELQGHCRRMPWTGIVMFAAAIGLSGVPPFCNFFGEAKIDEELERHGLAWLTIVIALSGVLTAGAVLRIVARVFLGLGERDGGGAGGPKIPMNRETQGPKRRTPVTMFLPALVLLSLSIIIALPGQLRSSIETLSLHMTDAEAYRALVLQGVPSGFGMRATPSTNFPSFWRELATGLCAMLLAWAGLYPSVLGRMANALKALIHPIRIIHTGRIGDYLAWFVFGVAAYAGFLLLWERMG
jgi:multicomponent Na+:H+ antiporter subunit D